MNLYRIEFKPVIPMRDGATGRPNGFSQLATETKVQWYGTMVDMRKARTALKKSGAQIIEAEPTEVPTDKAGLLAWLNECCGVRQ
jgi:hypothetical protein